MLNRDTIDRICELSRPEEVEIDGRKYTTHNLHRVEEPLAAGFGVNSLIGLVGYIKEAKEIDGPNDVVIVVNSPTEVVVVGHPVGPFQQRRTYCIATLSNSPFRFNDFLSQEEFVIGLMTQFEKTDPLDDVVAVAGNLAVNSEVKTEDDGFTQRVALNAGVVRRAETTVENPVALKPFRTFLEVNQPECKLILRFKKHGDSILCALREADGGLWKNDAKNAIRDYLVGQLPDFVVLA